MKVALYCRVSSEEQAINGYSIDAQLEELQQYAKKHNYSVVDKYIDAGVSGGLLHRPELDRLLEDVRKNKIELIIFVKLDRWFRSVAHYYKIQEVLEQHNVNWLATQEDYETITSSGKFKVNIMLSVSQQFKDATSERIKSVFKYKVANSKETITGNCPHGYSIADKKFVVNNEEVNDIKLMFDKFIETNSLSKTVDWYINNVEHVCYAQIKNRLKDKRYIGIYTYNGVEYNDYYPRIIDDDVFYKAQQVFETNIKKQPTTSHTKRTYKYSGIIYCGICGNKMSGKCSNGTKYYICKSYKNKLCTNKKHISESYIDKLITSKIKERAQDVYIDIINQKAKQKDVTKNISSIKNKIQKLQDIYLDGLIDKQSYTARYTALNDELVSATNIRCNVDTENIENFKSGTFIDLYNQLDDEHKAIWNKRCIKYIKIQNEDIELELVY